MIFNDVMTYISDKIPELFYFHPALSSADGHFACSEFEGSNVEADVDHLGETDVPDYDMAVEIFGACIPDDSMAIEFFGSILDNKVSVEIFTVLPYFDSSEEFNGSLGAQRKRPPIMMPP